MIISNELLKALKALIKGNFIDEETVGRVLALHSFLPYQNILDSMGKQAFRVPDFLRKEAVDNEQADAEDFEDECEQADYMLSSDSAAFMEPEKIGPLEKSD